MFCFYGYDGPGHYLELINETDGLVFAYLVDSWATEHVMSLEPNSSARYRCPFRSQTFVFSSCAREPLIFYKESGASSPNHYCLKLPHYDPDSRVYYTYNKTPTLVRIRSPPERTLKRICLEIVADRLLKSKCGIEKLPIPKRLRDRFAAKPSSKVDQLCLPLNLKDDLRQLVEHPSDYSRAKHLIQGVAPMRHLVN